MNPGTATNHEAEAHPGTVGAPRRLRILYIYPDTVGLSAEAAKNPLHFLSEYLEGDYLAVWIVPDQQTAEAQAAQIRQASGSFDFCWIRRDARPPLLRRLAQIAFYVRTGWKLARKHGRYDAIVVYGPFSTAVAGLILRRLLRAKLIVEFPGHPFRSFELYPGWIQRVKRRLAPHWTRYVASTADHVRLLYPHQLDEIDVDIEGKSSVFHNFTTVKSMTAVQRSGMVDAPFVLFMGYPFHLKGVDLLIRAFQQITADYPLHELLLVGYCPDPAPYLELAAGNPRVRIVPPLPHDDAMQLMTQCDVFVLPSRIEAMGRVLLEAMAARRPIIAARAGGIPHYVHHGVNGLLFEPENPDELADHLRLLLSDTARAGELAARGYERVRAQMSEEQYALRFYEMVRAACG